VLFRLRTDYDAGALSSSARCSCSALKLTVFSGSGSKCVRCTALSVDNNNAHHVSIESHIATNYSGLLATFLQIKPQLALAVILERKNGGGGEGGGGGTRRGRQPETPNEVLISTCMAIGPNCESFDGGPQWSYVQ
jgi:hypothetical protein